MALHVKCWNLMKIASSGGSQTTLKVEVVYIFNFYNLYIKFNFVCKTKVRLINFLKKSALSL